MKQLTYIFITERDVPDNILDAAKSLVLYGVEQNYIIEYYDSDTLYPF